MMSPSQLNSINMLDPRHYEKTKTHVCGAMGLMCGANLRDLILESNRSLVHKASQTVQNFKIKTKIKPELTNQTDR